MVRRILSAAATLVLTGAISAFAIGTAEQQTSRQQGGAHSSPASQPAQRWARRASRSRCVEAPLRIGAAAVLDHGHLRARPGEVVFVELVEAERYQSWPAGSKPPPTAFPWLRPRSSSPRVLRGVPLCPQRGISTLPVHISAFRAIDPGTARLTAPLAPSWRAAKPHVRKGLRPYRAAVIVAGGSGAARSGTLAGRVQLCGGPAPGRCHTATFGSCLPPEGCLSTDRVLIATPQGERVAERRLHHARFHLQMAPGRYAVTLLGDGKHVHARVMERRHVRVRAGRRTLIRFSFSIP